MFISSRNARPAIRNLFPVGGVVNWTKTRQFQHKLSCAPVMSPERVEICLSADSARSSTDFQTLT